MELNDDLEDCHEIVPDFYAHRSTTVARARLCGDCKHYTIKNQLLTCIRCELELRPTLKSHTDSKGKVGWLANCPKFERKC